MHSDLLTADKVPWKRRCPSLRVFARTSAKLRSLEELLPELSCDEFDELLYVSGPAISGATDFAQPGMDVRG